MSTDPGHDMLWQRVHAHLDAGGDPLDDDALCDALSEDPELFARVVRLRDDLQALAVTRVGPSRRAAARIVPWLLAAASAAAVLALIWLESSPGRVEIPVPTATGRILGYRAAATERVGGQTIERSLELRPSGRIASRRTATIEWSPDERPTTDHPTVLSYRASVTEE